MNTMQIAGTLLTASVEDRILSYRLLPFGEPGRTNVGTITASASSLTIPDDVSSLVVNVEHNPTLPVAKFDTITATDTGLEATIRVLATKAGDDLLLEASEGVRTGISVEVDNPVRRNGRLLAGVLSGAGVCVNPAFPSAQLVASDAGELPEGMPEDQEEHSETTSVVVIDGVEYVRKTTSTYITETTPKEEPEGDQAEQSAESENEMSTLTAAAVQAAGIGGQATNPEKDKTANEVFKMLASAFKSKSQDKLVAALANVVHDDGDNDGDGLGEIAAASAWLGEVYSKAAYVRKYIPLIANGNLTSYQEKGFNFGTKPVVAKYTGNKADVPTGGMTVVPVTYLAERWAHAADLDRRFIDFSDQDVIRAFVEAQVESYKKVTDLDTLTNIFAKANTFTPGTVPSGINATLAAIVDGALNLIAADFNPTFAVVGSDIYRAMALTKKDEIPEYLSATAGLTTGTVEGFRILPSSHASALGNVLVGDGSTVRFKELGGGSPIRVEAEHVAQGGKDFGVFGYTSFQELVDGGVVKADLVP